MDRCAALYSQPPKPPTPRAQAEIDRDSLIIIRPDGRWQRLALHGSSHEVRDAACEARFVRHLIVHLPHGREDLITPPDVGAIAPRAAELPRAPGDAAVVETPVWEAIAEWLDGRGRLGGCTVAQLARLARVATPVFAHAVGEIAARLALELVCVQTGPLRGGVAVRDALRPLEQAARTSERAAAALLAATAYLRHAAVRTGAAP